MSVAQPHIENGFVSRNKETLRNFGKFWTISLEKHNHLYESEKPSLQNVFLSKKPFFSPLLWLLRALIRNPWVFSHMALLVPKPSPQKIFSPAAHAYAWILLGKSP